MGAFLLAVGARDNKKPLLINSVRALFYRCLKTIVLNLVLSENLE